MAKAEGLNVKLLVPYLLYPVAEGAYRDFFASVRKGLDHRAVPPGPVPQAAAHAPGPARGRAAPWPAAARTRSCPARSSRPATNSSRNCSAATRATSSPRSDVDHDRDHAAEYQPKDYKSDLKPIWCPGCGDYGVVQAIYRALAAIGRPPHEIAFVSGIGCSSRIPGYTTAYGFNSVHGRALPIAQGIKMANPDLLVLAAGGDGDGFSIGGGHIAHTIRRNMDITYIVMDNQIYGLTKGQLSPTSPEGPHHRHLATTAAWRSR